MVLADYAQQQSQNQTYDLNAFTSRIASHYTREIITGLIKIVVEANNHKLIKAVEGTCQLIADALASYSKKVIKEKLGSVVKHVLEAYELKFGSNV